MSNDFNYSVACPACAQQFLVVEDMTAHVTSHDSEPLLCVSVLGLPFRLRRKPDTGHFHCPYFDCEFEDSFGKLVAHMNGYHLMGWIAAFFSTSNDDGEPPLKRRASRSLSPALRHPPILRKGVVSDAELQFPNTAVPDLAKTVELPSSSSPPLHSSSPFATQSHSALFSNSRNINTASAPSSSTSRSSGSASSPILIRNSKRASSSRDANNASAPSSSTSFSSGPASSPILFHNSKGVLINRILHSVFREHRFPDAILDFIAECLVPMLPTCVTHSVLGIQMTSSHDNLNKCTSGMSWRTDHYRIHFRDHIRCLSFDGCWSCLCPNPLPRFAHLSPYKTKCYETQHLDWWRGLVYIVNRCKAIREKVFPFLGLPPDPIDSVTYARWITGTNIFNTDMRIANHVAIVFGYFYLLKEGSIPTGPHDFDDLPD